MLCFKIIGTLGTSLYYVRHLILQKFHCGYTWGKSTPNALSHMRYYFVELLYVIEVYGINVLVKVHLLLIVIVD